MSYVNRAIIFFLCSFFSTHLPASIRCSFVGNKACAEQILQDCLEPFGVSRATMPIDWLCREIEQLYKRRGFAHAVVSGVREENDLTFVVVEGEQEKVPPVAVPSVIDAAPVPEIQRAFGQTTFVTNTQVPDHYLFRGLSYAPNDPWESAEIKRTIRNFKDLEVFDRIEIAPALMTEPQDAWPMVIQLMQDTAYEVRVRAGAGLDGGGPEYSFAGLTYKIGGALIAKNPFQHADQMRFDFDQTFTYRKAVLTYRRPWIKHWPVIFTVKGYSNAYEQPSVGGETQSLYKVYQNGVLCECAHKYGTHTWGVNIGFEVDKIKPMSDKCHPTSLEQITKAINFEPILANRYIPYAVLEPTVFLNYLDDTVSSHIGMSTLISAKSMIPLGVCPQAYFVKFLLEQSAFRPCGPIIFAIRARAGYIFQHTFDSILPIERFYLGGAYSIRSYQTDMAPPLGRYVDTQGNSFFVPQGGKSMLSLNAEMRIPLKYGCSVVFFQDAGALSTTRWTDIIPPHIVTGSGFGLRSETPIGVIRFDAAWKWKKHIPNESRYAWHLVLGQLF